MSILNKIYIANRNSYDNQQIKDTNSFYLIDEPNGCRSMYMGDKLVSGDFRIIKGTEASVTEKKTGVIYYISEFGKTTDRAGSPWIGFWDGTKWVPMSESSSVKSLTEAVDKLNGDDSTEGSVAKAIKDAIEALDFTDTVTAGSVVVAVNETDGKISVTKQPITLTKNDNEYTLKVGDEVIGDKITVTEVKTATILSQKEPDAEDGLVLASDAYTEINKIKTSITELDVTTLKQQVDTNKASIETLNGGDTVQGSVAKTVKDAIDNLNIDNTINTAIEALDVADTPTEGSVVVAVSETDGKISTTKQAVTIEKSTTGTVTDYTLKIGGNAIAQKISVPDSARLLETSKLGDANDTFSEDTGAISAAIAPSGTEVLHLVFKLADDKFEKVSINVEDFLNEAEFKNGLKVLNHEVSVDLTENGFLQLDGDTEGSKTLGAKVVTIESQKETDAEDGLVKASDAYKVISDNEKVTAAALNDLHTRIGDNDNLFTDAYSTVNAINELNNRLGDNDTLQTESKIAVGAINELTTKVTTNTNEIANLKKVTYENGLSLSSDKVSVDLTEDGFLQLDGETEGSKTLGARVVTIETQKEAKAEDGLVKASDAYKVISDIEIVTAAALNDLHKRIGDNDDLQTTSKDAVGAINELEDEITNIDKVLGEALNDLNNKIQALSFRIEAIELAL